MMYMVIIHFIMYQYYPVLVIKRLVDRTASCRRWEHVRSQGDDYASIWTCVRLEDAYRCRPRHRYQELVPADPRPVDSLQSRTSRRKAGHPHSTLGCQARSRPSSPG